MGDERDAATWEAAAAQCYTQTEQLQRSLATAHERGRIPRELVGLGAVLTQQARVDMLRAVEASRWQREARRLRRAVWGLAGVSVVSLCVAVAALVCCVRAAGP